MPNNYIQFSELIEAQFNKGGKHAEISAATPPPFTISPGDTIRWKAFGAASDISPNPIDGSAANSNTEIISINDNVLGMMAAGDVRNNYFMTGATWTIGGAPPTAGQPSPGNPGNQVGTSQLANTTMETYEDGNDTTSSNTGNNFNSNCFSCHVSDAQNPGASPIDITALSHILSTASSNRSSDEMTVSRRMRCRLVAAEPWRPDPRGGRLPRRGHL